MRLFKVLVPVLIGALVAWSAGRLLKKEGIDQSRTSRLRVGTNAEYPPFAYIDDEGTIVGLDIDLIREISNRLGREMELADAPFDSMLIEMQLGKFDVLAAGLSMNSARAKQMLFTKPYLEDSFVVLIPIGDPPVESPDQLIDRIVIVNTGYTSERLAEEVGMKNIVRLANPAESMTTLASGRADAYITAKTAAIPIMNSYGKGKFAIYEIAPNAEKCALAVSKDKPELLAQINKILDQMENDGTLRKIRSRWGV